MLGYQYLHGNPHLFLNPAPEDGKTLSDVYELPYACNAHADTHRLMMLSKVKLRPAEWLMGKGAGCKAQTPRFLGSNPPLHIGVKEQLHKGSRSPPAPVAQACIYTHADMQTQIHRHKQYLLFFFSSPRLALNS